KVDLPEPLAPMIAVRAAVRLRSTSCSSTVSSTAYPTPVQWIAVSVTTASARMGDAPRSGERPRVRPAQGHGQQHRDSGLEQVAGQEDQTGEDRRPERHTSDQRLDRDAEQVDHQDAPDQRGDAGAPPGEERAVRDQSDDDDTGDPADHVPDRRSDEDPQSP